MKEVQSEYSIRTKITKIFDGIDYDGKIVKDSGRYYHVEYEDGDEEDMTHTKITKCIPKIQYMGGYGRALQALFNKTIIITTK